MFDFKNLQGCFDSSTKFSFSLHFIHPDISQLDLWFLRNVTYLKIRRFVLLNKLARSQVGKLIFSSQGADALRIVYTYIIIK